MATESGKIGEGALKAFARQGLAELRAALPLADSPVAQPTDYGMWGMATPGEVAAERSGDERSVAADKDSVLADRLNQLGAAREDHGRDDRGMERE
jgi:hypothetical protein